jgi:hypothetical protein
MIRVVLPTYLQRLANVAREIQLDLSGEITIALLLDAIEEEYPMLQGTIRDYDTKERRPYLRFFACGQDLSPLSTEAHIPEEVLEGKEVFRIVGAMSGG